MPGCTFDDFEPGQVCRLGSRAVAEAEIVDFARQFDPQPFHLDPEQARVDLRRPDREQLAHGLDVDAALRRLDAGQLGGDGLARDRGAALALAPVRPGDTLSGRLTVLEGDHVREPARPRHRPHSRQDERTGRRHRDGDDLARPLRAPPGVTDCCARHGQGGALRREDGLADGAGRYRRKGPGRDGALARPAGRGAEVEGAWCSRSAAASARSRSSC